MESYVNPWDKRFDEEEYIYGKEPNHFLKNMAAKLLKKETLTIAEGEGEKCCLFSKAWPHRNSMGLCPIGY